MQITALVFHLIACISNLSSAVDRLRVNKNSSVFVFQESGGSESPRASRLCGGMCLKVDRGPGDGDRDGDRDEDRDGDGEVGLKDARCGTRECELRSFRSKSKSLRSIKKSFRSTQKSIRYRDTTSGT